MEWQWQTFLRTLKWIVWSQFKCSNTYFSIFALFQELFIHWQDEFKYSFYPFWNVVHSKTIRCNFEYIGLIVSWWKFKTCHDHSIFNNMHAWNISYEYIEYIWQIQCQSYSCSESNKSLQPVHLIMTHKILFLWYGHNESLTISLVMSLNVWDSCIYCHTKHLFSCILFEYNVLPYECHLHEGIYSVTI